MRFGAIAANSVCNRKVIFLSQAVTIGKGQASVSIRSQKNITWLIVHMLLLLLFAACGGGAPSPGTQTPLAEASPTTTVTLLNINLNDTYYGDQDNNATNPPTWEVPAGGFVILNMENHGKLEHNWAIVKKGVTPPTPYKQGQAGDIILYGAGMVYGHNKTTITLVAPSEPGEYIVMCTVENHFPLMQGRLIVK
jgi:hypothetical protein